MRRKWFALKVINYIFANLKSGVVAQLVRASDS